jgi:uncharacterized protein
MQTILADWRANAERHYKSNFRFLRSLKMKDDRVVDRVAHRLHDEAFSIIDCLQCANCCKTVSPLFRKSDIRRIAENLGLKPADFVATYLEVDEHGDLFLRNSPCPFLTDNRCTIYEIRPRDCVAYPHTGKRGFSGRTHLHAANSVDCPAVFYIVEQLSVRRR